MLMAERGVVSAPNMAIGQPFTINGVQPTSSVDRYTVSNAAPPAPNAAKPAH
jgi:hypothetical protein